MTRRKTTMYLDEDVLRAMKIAAAREDKTEYQVVEDALRKHLGWDVVERVRTRASMREDASMKLALEAQRAARKKHRS